MPEMLRRQSDGRVLLLQSFVFLVIGQISFAQRVQPEIKNINDVTIILHRGGGMGGGPSYKLVISGDGTVHYEGYRGVFVRGKRVKHISSSQKIGRASCREI